MWKVIGLSNAQALVRALLSVHPAANGYLVATMEARKGTGYPTSYADGPG